MMDDADGQRHPELAAKIAGWLFGEKYRLLCLYHSRHYAKQAGAEPSKLCWADKMSIIFDPWFFYLPRAWASRELFEYRDNADGVLIGKSAPHREWYRIVRKRLVTLGKEQRGDAAVYMRSKS
ncbi:hypothetical protein SDC9_178851 [bioreactor metagenome]|uniref:Uncharacterized protein n=1 Tax=bioreactor metagenome TaxID=1076179 RepID=A0A645GXC8_9ZZZZ